MKPLKDPTRSAPITQSQLTESKLRAAAALAKVDKVQLIASYLDSQRTHLNAFAMEGREAFTSWNRSCSPAVDKAQVGSPIRDAGFTTPILKPRVPKEAIDSNKEEPETVATPLVKATQVAVRPKKRARESADNRAQDAARPAKRSRGAPDESVTKSTRHTKVHEKRDGSSDRERIAILSGRRERRRVKKAIVQPKPSPQKSADMPPKGNRKGGKKRKNDISAGLALMHGFSATNVGSSRLTLKPTFGVFNKGKASAKTGTSSKAKPKPKTTERIWNEIEFLGDIKRKRSDARFDRNSVVTLSSRESTDSSSSSASTEIPCPPKKRKVARTPAKASPPGGKKDLVTNERTTRNHSKDVKKRQVRTPDLSSEEPNRPPTNVTSSVAPDEQPLRADSVVWDIESIAKASSKDLAELAEELASSPAKDGTLILNTRVTKWHDCDISDPPVRQPDPGQPRESPKDLRAPGNHPTQDSPLVQNGPLSHASLCPSQSISQVLHRADALQASQMDPVYSEPFRSENDPRVMYSCEEQYSQPSEEPVCPPQDMAHRQVYEDVPFDALDEMDQSPTAHDHNLPPCGERRNPEYEYQDSLLFSDDYLDHLPACSASSHLNYLPMNHLGHNFGHSYACDRSETPGSYELLGSFDDNDSISYLDDNPEYIDAPWQSCDSYYNAPYDEVALEPQATEELYEDPNDLADTVSYFSADEDYAYVDSESAPWPCVSPQESLVDEASAVTSLLVKQRFRPRTLLHEYSPTSLVLDTPETDSGFMTGRLMLPTLAQVEEDVAKHMLHHWLPQKL